MQKLLKIISISCIVFMVACGQDKDTSKNIVLDQSNTDNALATTYPTLMSTLASPVGDASYTLLTDEPIVDHEPPRARTQIIRDNNTLQALLRPSAAQIKQPIDFDQQTVIAISVYGGCNKNIAIESVLKGIEQTTITYRLVDIPINDICNQAKVNITQLIALPFATDKLSFVEHADSTNSTVTTVSGQNNDQANAPPPILLKGATVFNSKTLEINQQNVLLRNGKVEDASNSLTAAPNVTEYDLTGAFVMPGLIDTHTHRNSQAVADAPKDGSGMGIREVLLSQDYKVFQTLTNDVNLGVTTVNLLGGPTFGDIYLKNTIKRLGNMAPNLMAAGGTMTQTRGYPHYVDSVLGGVLMIKLEASTPENARRIARYMAKQNIDHFKVMASERAMGGRDFPDYMQPKPEIIAAFIDEAHKLGKRVFTHVYGNKGHKIAVDNNTDVLAHASFDPLDDEMIAEVVRKKIPVIGTVAIMQGALNGQYPYDQSVTGPYFDLDGWIKSGRQPSFPDQPLSATAGAPVFDYPMQLEALKRVQKNVAENTAKLIKAGAVVGLGTDNGTTVPEEMLEILRYTTMPKVLQIATYNSAIVLNRQDSIGYLGKGYQADIVVYKKSPVEDYKILRKGPMMVIRNGQIVRCDREQYHKCPDGINKTFRDYTNAEKNEFSVGYKGAIGLNVLLKTNSYLSEVLFGK